MVGLHASAQFGKATCAERQIGVTLKTPLPKTKKTKASHKSSKHVPEAPNQKRTCALSLRGVNSCGFGH